MSVMKMKEYVAIQEKICEKNDDIAPRLYDEYGVTADFAMTAELVY